MKLLLSLLIAPLVVVAGGPAPDKFELRFPTKEHLSASQLYEFGNTAIAIDKVIGQFVLLDVVVTIERNVPLVEIVIPKEVASNSARLTKVINAHLISAITAASALKKGERVHIEGMIVAEGYNAYTIFLHKAQLIK